MWICISACLIAIGYAACRIRKPREDALLKVCLAIGVLSEAIKLFSVIRILPMVEVVVKGDALKYVYAGQRRFAAQLQKHDGIAADDGYTDLLPQFDLFPARV